MKTWEMVKELTEHPEKKFKSIHEDQSIAPTFAVVEIGGIMFKNSLGESTALYYIGSDWRWEEVKEPVKEPVTFMEVLEAVDESEGDILLTIENEDYEEKIKSETLDVILARLANAHLDTGVASILLNSKWYIEE